jgi:chromosomal replication initiator protein
VVDRVAVIDLPRCEDVAPRGPSAGIAGFVAGPENQLAVTALERVLRGDDALEDAPWLNPLVLTGPSGVGKSHLARGIARYWSQLVGADSVGYFTAIDFARQLHAARNDGQVEFFRTLLSSLKLMVVEDLDQLPQRTFVQRELRDTIDTLVEADCLVVLTANDSLHLEPGLRDRVLGGLGVRLCPPGVAAREEILRRASSARGLTLSDEQLQHLARRFDASASQLMRALAELDLQQSTGQDAAAVRAASPELRQIVAVVARYYSLTQASLLSPARRKSLVHARAMVVYLARLLTDLSYAQIGAGLGHRDHSTIMHAQQCIQLLAATDAATQRDLDQLRRILSAA